MVDHLCRRLSKCRGRIVPEGHATSIGNLLREEIFQPEGLRLRVCPGVDSIAAEAVDSHDTRETAVSESIEQGETAASGSSGGTHSMAGDVVAS
jgi:hypothetical protein